jgi:equilibrative nucleoside transporter 1/2/3
MKEVKKNEAIRREPSKGRVTAYIVCWLLGNGCLFGWNSLLTIEDYFSVVFAAYHPTRVFTLVYQPFALITIFILTHFEARVNTRLRILTGYSLFFLLVLLIPIVSATLPYM